MNDHPEHWPASNPRSPSPGPAQDQARSLAEPVPDQARSLAEPVPDQARSLAEPAPPAGAGPQAGGPGDAVPPAGAQYSAQQQQYGQPQPYAHVSPYGAPAAGYPVQQAVAPKNPAIGLLISVFLPGVGSMVNGSGGRGALILALYVVGWLLSFFLIGIPLLIGAWVWGLVDGYTSAQRWNRQHGIIS